MAWITGAEDTLSKPADDSNLEEVSATTDVGSQPELDGLKFNTNKSANSVPGEE